MPIEIIPKPAPSTATGDILDLSNPDDVKRIARKHKERDRNPIIRAWGDAAHSGQQSRTGRKRKGIRLPLRRAVEKIKAASFENLLETLSNEDRMADLYESTDKELAIDISAVEVDCAKKKVTYSVRGSSKTHGVGYKRLSEIYQKTKS